VAIAFAVTVTVEVLQGVLVPGRQASITDVASNTIGGLLGHLLAGIVVVSATAAPRTARRLALGYLVTWLAATWLGAALLRPANARMGQRSECGPDAQLPDCFPGQLVGPPRLGAPGRPAVALEHPGQFSLVGPDATLAIDVVDGGELAAPGLVAGVAGARTESLLTIEQQHGLLAFYARARGQDLGLRSPAVVLPGVLGRPGRRLSISAGVTGSSRWLEADGRRAELTPSAAEGWRLLFPWTALTGSAIVAVGALFQLGTLLPLGYWVGRASGLLRRPPGVAAASGRAADRGLMPALAMSTIALGFIGGARVFALASPRTADWAGAALGLLLGAKLSQMTAPAATP
jgi:hypothetical protein